MADRFKLHPSASDFLSPELDGYIYPKSIHSTSGGVENAVSLLSGSRAFDVTASQTCTLTSTSSSKARIILDYGVVVAGIPSFFITGFSSEDPAQYVMLRSKYTEALAYVDREGGDGPFPFTASNDTLRENE